jgi:SAM-dependent methyltransferase
VYSDWTTTFFGGLAVEFWVKVAPPPTEAEIGFLRDTFGDAKRILDVACGAGRYTIPLSRAGFQTTGVDVSTAFLDVARHAAPDLDWQQRDIRELAWDDAFDGAVCFGNSFGYFDPQESARFLRGVANALRPDAAFVLETGALAESLLPSLQQSRRIEIEEMIFSSTNAYDANDSRLDIDYTFERGDLRETKAASTWVFTAREVSDMLRAAGFAGVTIYASADGTPFTLGSPRAIFVARRSDRIAPLNNKKEKRI